MQKSGKLLYMFVLSGVCLRFFLTAANILFLICQNHGNKIIYIIHLDCGITYKDKDEIYIRMKKALFYKNCNIDITDYRHTQIY